MICDGTLERDAASGPAARRIAMRPPAFSAPGRASSTTATLSTRLSIAFVIILTAERTIIAWQGDNDDRLQAIPDSAGVFMFSPTVSCDRHKHRLSTQSGCDRRRPRQRRSGHAGSSSPDRFLRGIRLSPPFKDQRTRTGTSRHADAHGKSHLRLVNASLYRETFFCVSTFVRTRMSATRPLRSPGDTCK